MKIQEKKRESVLIGNLWKVVISITFPIFMYQLMNVFYTLIDQIMVSTISTSSVSAVAAITQIKNLISSLGAGLAAGGGILIARAYGEGDYEKSSKYANVTLSLSFIVIALILLLMPFSNLILVLAQVPDDLITISSTYFLLQLIEQGIMVFNSYFIGIEKAKCNTKIILISNIIIMIVKLALNALFIYGLGITNLAFVELSSIISQLIMMIIGIFYVFDKNSVIKVSLKKLSLSWKYSKHIIIISFPLFLGKMVISLGKVTVNAMCKYYGSLTVGALAISNNLSGLITNPCLAFEDSESSIVSMNLGNINMKRCLKTFIVTMVYSVIWGTIGFLCVRVLFEDEIVGLFSLSKSNDSAEFMQMIKDIFYYDCLTIPALAINSAILGILYGYGQTFLSTVNNLLRIVTRITVLFILQHFTDLGAEAAGISMGISNIIIAIFAVIFLIVFLIKIKVKGYNGLHFSDKEPKMVYVDGKLVNEELVNADN